MCRKVAAWGWGWEEGGDVRGTRGLGQVGGDLPSFVMMLWEVWIRTVCILSVYFIIPQSIWGEN